MSDTKITSSNKQPTSWFRRSKTTADKISQLETEIEARREEINRIGYAPLMDDDDISAPADTATPTKSLQQLEGLILQCEERMAKATAAAANDNHNEKEYHKTFYPEDYELPPKIPEIMDTEEDPASSPRMTNINLEDISMMTSFMRSNSVPSPSRVHKIFPRPSLDDSDSDYDTDIIRDMKDTFRKIICEKAEKKDTKTSNNSFYTSELESKFALQKKKNETLEAECTRLLELSSTLEEQKSSQEITIEYLKSEMVNLLIAKTAKEEALDTELDHFISTITKLKRTFQVSANQSQKMIQDLGRQSSCLEDEIAQLKAENTNLHIRALVLEEEKARVEEEMKTEMSLMYIETGRHEIL